MVWIDPLPEFQVEDIITFDTYQVGLLFTEEKNNYSLRSLLVVAQTDVSSTEIRLDTSVSATTNMERREY